jgi:hypothetical protein
LRLLPEMFKENLRLRIGTARLETASFLPRLPTGGEGVKRHKLVSDQIPSP